MKLETTPIPGLLIVHPQVYKDERGFFYETYNWVKFKKLGINVHWMQDNYARSCENTLRGLHFQLGRGQAKLVRCVAGRVWDVAVDIRPGSATFGRWHGVELSDENHAMVFIPEGFAHGYCVLSETADVVYKCSTVYNPGTESEFRWDDPLIGVEWPVREPVLSVRDQNAQSFTEYLQHVNETHYSRVTVPV
jgi:dTDP-4-dehydrorhamnose 3,5-epimerase